MKRKILLIEDNNDLRTAIKDYFTMHSKGEFIVDELPDGVLSGISYEINEYDFILIDVMLPNVDGFSLCREIRKMTDCPVCFITALGEEEEKKRGYYLGADDYVVKPFLLSELFLKTQAWIRRNNRTDTVGVIKFKNISINTVNRTCFIEEKQVSLTNLEFEILQYFIENQGRIITRVNLLNAVWTEKLDINERTVDSHIKKIRRALGEYGNYIKTVHGVGYCLNEE